MTQLTLSKLRDVADSLTLLAGTFQTKPFYLRAKQIRQADKALISADALFISQLSQEAKQWKEAYEGLQVLQNKLATLEDKTNQINELEENIHSFKLITNAWLELNETERFQIVQNSKRANHFIVHQNDKVEAHIIHRYKRFKALKDLTAYSENTNYLCEAIFHYENRERYENNISKLEEKISKSAERLKTVQRGFWIAILFCIFVVTIPICFPFAINLWRRKREIESQTANYEETLRRENKRMIASDEGAVIAQEIREILGNVSLELIREVLIEVKELRAEFLGPHRTASSTSLLLNYMETNKEKLQQVFGDIPEDPLESFYWLCENVHKFQNTEFHILELEEKKNNLIAQQKQLVKGYSKETLMSSIVNLQTVIQSTLHIPLENENKIYFAELCIHIPPVLNQIREILFYASRNQAVDENYWDTMKMKIQSFSNTLSLCILEAELANYKELESERLPEKKCAAIS